MGVFIIVKYLEKFKLKYAKFKQKKLVAYVVLAICSFIVVYMLFIKNTDEIKVLDEAQLNVVDTPKTSKILYTVNNDFTELKNPFSFAHEHENEQKKELVENVEGKIVKEDKIVTNEQKIPSKQDTKTKLQANKTIDTTKQQKNYKVKAIFDINQQKSALLDINGQEVRVQEGTKLNGATVISIAQNNVILQNTKGMSINCSLNNF